jgi:uncharacterized protein YjdB
MKKALIIILSIILVVTFLIMAVGFTSVPVKSIALDKDKITLKAGNTCTLMVTITPSDVTDKILTYF